MNGQGTSDSPDLLPDEAEYVIDYLYRLMCHPLHPILPPKIMKKLLNVSHIHTYSPLLKTVVFKNFN